MSRYHEDLRTREKIDALLTQNATIQAGMGKEFSKKSPQRKEAKEQWLVLWKKIYELDPEFANSIKD
jgi:hypothetical protein